MKLLIVYATEEGHTRKICRFLRDEAVDQGHRVELVNANDEPPQPAEFDKVVIASPIHIGKFHREARDFIHQYDLQLNLLPTAFVTVSLTASDKTDSKGMKELQRITEKFLAETAWRPNRVEHVAGALSFSKYGWVTAFIMQSIAKKHGELVDRDCDVEETDWEQVKRFASEFFV
mmetsp:Transcript_21363/g.52165  ORF Transcript_21363/g.52165 Transcript_21363/m.52165 type:complete len:175 (+) Transcript_21363:115-639(+)|eukprot:CAMPEP_0198358602 /NCGR_PEP_ID=MMETSP1450-20131203/131448_1 /TAXON_ID=753684 ORGANISM="Madagascaria erythrocladiodes, Strain CCMP3234" /NCGR_SAMPLE_ID=MMETSP1450 /ASSEMBLY_ACC=CAM_ASM_001115 /LENGTH=174 /DNA_ID=CAMNT_0044065361 /DNA_START=63 /DNA_END=587 /DNA_ORIENTATION=+